MIYEHEVKWTSQPKPESDGWDFLAAWRWSQFPPQEFPQPREYLVTYPQKRDQLAEKAKAYLESRGLSWEIASSSNWYPALYRGPRIIIPCTRNDGGKFWQGRLIDSIIRAESKHILARWDSPPGPRGDAIVLLGTPGDRRAIFIVEGPMDALAIAGCNLPAVAILGNKPTISVVEHVGDVVDNYERVIAIPDRDSIPSWAKIQRLFSAIGVHTKLMEPWSPHKDVAAMDKQTREDFLNIAIES